MVHTGDNKYSIHTVHYVIPGEDNIIYVDATKNA